MNQVSVKLQVFFEAPFWIGICENVLDGDLSVCKITFGAEPKDQQLHEYILTHWYVLKFSPTVKNKVSAKAKVNPKRMQRSVTKQIQEIGVGTKSQQALKLQHEQNKSARKLRAREKNELEKERKFALKQQKRKEKHKGK